MFLMNINKTTMVNTYVLVVASINCSRSRWSLGYRDEFISSSSRQKQCCDLETMVSRLECTRVHSVLEIGWPRSRSRSRDLKAKVSVKVLRPDGQGFGLYVVLET